MATVVLREPLPDGTIKVWWDDGQTRIFGTPQDPVAAAQRAGQVSSAQTRAIYEDPWYQENVLGPMNRSTEQQAQDRATMLQNQAKQLELQGRIADANILNQQAQVELRKAELRQSGYLTGRGQDLQANLSLAQMRGPGNAAQFIDAGNRLQGFGTQTGALANIAAGKMPGGGSFNAFSGKPVSLQDRMSGMLGASQSQIDERDRNDRALARSIYSNAGQMQRGSLESLDPFTRKYLGSYGEAEGFDDETFQNAYDRAGIMQGRRSY